jgi:hypothetical protein
MSLEKKTFVLSRRVWISINILDKVLPTSQTLGAKTHKQCCHIDVSDGYGL